MLNLTDPARTSDGHDVVVGLRVHDYDWKWGVVESPSCPCNYSKAEHQATDLCNTWDGWWNVKRDDGGRSLMDGTRLSVKGWDK